jgi:hypothetical protein
MGGMSKEQVKAILDRVLTWPEQRQEDAAKVLMLMEASEWAKRHPGSDVTRAPNFVGLIPGYATGACG